MPKICVILVLVIFCGVTQCLGEARQGDSILVRITPSPQQSDPAPDDQQAVSQPMGPRAPTPKEKLYVFWILGKMLSYPVDRAEKYIRGKLEGFSRQPVAVPAASPTTANPFDTARQRDIPPAPPAMEGAAADRRLYRFPRASYGLAFKMVLFLRPLPGSKSL